MDSEYLRLNFGGKYSANIGKEGYVRDYNHRYILYDKRPPIGFISLATNILTDFYLANIKQTTKQWQKDKKQYSHYWTYDPKKPLTASVPISYLIFSEELRTYNHFDNDKFRLPLMQSDWLDSSIDLNINFHVNDKSGQVLKIEDGTTKAQYGEAFPIKPSIDREGHIFTTFQPQLIKRIIKLRQRLVENSNDALDADWILDLRGLINDSISLLDICLIQVYTKAEYMPKPTWTFDKSKIGEKHGRRINDKIKWVRQITGHNLDIEEERKVLDKLRNLRNHLNHFDPPTVVITLEEAAQWLNDVLQIGKILVKIRTALNESSSIPLINLLVQREVYFNPEPAFKERVPMNLATSGYSTSTWPNQKSQE